jgi:glutathione S-transferase
MVIKLYGHPESAFTHLVLITLKETSTPYEFHEVDFVARDMHRESYIEKHPFGQMPYIVRLSPSMPVHGLRALADSICLG